MRSTIAIKKRKTGTTITIKGPACNNWFASQLVKDKGADAALSGTCGPMHEAVKAVIAAQKTV